METLLSLDKSLFLLLNFDGGPAWDSFFWAISGKIIWAPLYLFILFLIYRQYGWKSVLVAIAIFALMVGVGDQLCNFFKNNLPKLRPTHDPEISPLISLVKNYRGKPYGTVSAHATISFAIAVFSSLTVRKRWFTVMILFWASLVAYSRIYIGAHFPMDILLGGALGSLIAYGGYRLFLIVSVKLGDKKLCE